MFELYGIALVLACAGIFLVLHVKLFNWLHAGIAAVIALLLCPLGDYVIELRQTGDQCTVSGEVHQATHFSRWKEYYEEAVYRTEYYTETEYYTDSNGKSRSRTVTKSREVFDHWEPCTRWHDDHYQVATTLGTWSDCQSRYTDIRMKFGGSENKVRGDRTTGEHASHMIAGDPYDYVTVNTTRYTYPVVGNKSFRNKLLASQSVYTFAEVPTELLSLLPNYPEVGDRYASNRLMVSGCDISVRDWDVINAKLGPGKHCNLIAVRFSDRDPIQYVDYLRSKWVGGKNNDLIICFAGSYLKPKWVEIISWSDSDLAKVKLRDLIMTKGFSKAALPDIERIVVSGWQPKNWQDFDILRVEPTWGELLVFFFVELLAVCATWGVSYYIALENQRSGTRSSYSSSDYYNYRNRRYR